MCFYKRYHAPKSYPQIVLKKYIFILVLSHELLQLLELIETIFVPQSIYILHVVCSLL
jgi:hypothetical protein